VVGKFKALALGIIAKKIFVERMMVRKREELFDIVNKTQVVKKEEIEDRFRDALAYC